jgi:hypothetical protein
MGFRVTSFLQSEKQGAEQSRADGGRMEKGTRARLRHQGRLSQAESGLAHAAGCFEVVVRNAPQLGGSLCITAQYITGPLWFVRAPRRAGGRLRRRRDWSCVLRGLRRPSGLFFSCLYLMSWLNKLGPRAGLTMGNRAEQACRVPVGLLGGVGV